MTSPSSQPTPPVSRRSRRGVVAKGRPGAVAGDPKDRRGHCVSVRLSEAELRWLDDARRGVRMRRGEYLRCAAVGQLPPPAPTIPAINARVSGELAKVGGNLMQLVRRLNDRGERNTPLTDFDYTAIHAAVVGLSEALIGATASVPMPAAQS